MAMNNQDEQLLFDVTKMGAIPTHLCSLSNVTVSPSLAGHWLQYSRPGNEFRVTPRTVDRYAKDMTKENWQYNGEPIIFGDDGLIMDGHHRLEACVHAGVTFVTDVSFGRPHENFAYVDSGKVRTTYHIAGMAGVPNPAAVSVAYKWVYRLEHDMLHKEGFNYRLPASEIPRMYERHPRLPDSAKSMPQGITSFMTRGVSVFLHYYLSTVDPLDADLFFESLISGHDLKEGNAILLLRNSLLLRRRVKRRDDQDNLHDIALTIKSWNYWREKRVLKQLRWPSTPNEKFPVPH